MGVIIAIIILLIVSSALKPEAANLQPLRTAYNWGVAARIVGTLAYMFYAFELTSGNVDAFVYDNWAERFAEYFLQGDLSPFTDPSMYRGGKLFYTNFVAYPAAIFLIITFNSTFGIYLLFSTACFAGLVLMVKSFFNNYPTLDRYRITMYVLLFPAVWFWTSTIGKDAFIFLGVGIICNSFRRNAINYFLMALGIGIVYAFRPPVAYMIIFAIAALYIFNLKDSFLMKIVKVMAGVAIVVFMLEYLGSEWRIEEFDAESIEQFQQNTLRNNYYGSGALDEKGGGLASIPQGIIDVLARPFIWETRDITTFLASIEITFMVVTLWIRRRSVALFFKSMLNTPLSTFIGSFVIIYVISAGLFENNIGLIARHRSILFPFLFLAAFSFNPVPMQSKLRQRRVLQPRNL